LPTGSLLAQAASDEGLQPGGATSDAAVEGDLDPNTTSADASDDEAEGTPDSFFEILAAGGPVGVLILLLSIAVAALVIEHLMTIRSTVLMPEGLSETVRKQLEQQQWTAAVQQCKLQPSLLGFVLHAGLSEREGGWEAVEKAMEDATAEQSARLFRKIEYLSVIGNIAPMLGLLGTVIGMIFAFREVADVQGAAGAGRLAQGIYLALITTVEGLIVAIPALAAFAIFRNRVDHLVAEATYVAQHTTTPMKRYRATVMPVEPPPEPPRSSMTGTP
jgi:biopolymer transport protein ExbB